LGSRESPWTNRDSNNRLGHPAHPGLVQIDPTDLGFADLARCRKLFQHIIGDETWIDATESVHKPMQDAFGLGHDLGKLLQ